MHDDLRVEIKRLAFRLQRIERRIGIEAESDGESADALVPDDPSEERQEGVSVPTRVADPSRQPLERAEPVASPSRRWSVPTEQNVEAGDSIESAIGIKVLGPVGAILVVIGAAFFAREFGANVWYSLPALLQALSIACFAGLLLLGGEIALRKFGKAASLGLYGAGLGILYMDAFAAFRWFEIVSEEGSFLLMAVVAACGFAITLRTKFLAIGILSLVGGYMTPILLWRASISGIEVAAYLTMLAGIALALSAWQPRPNRPLRYVAFAGQCILGLMVVAASQSQPIAAIVFICLWWFMFTAEAVFAALRRQSALGNVVISLLGTAAYVTCTAWILHFYTAIGSEYLGAFTCMIGLLCGAIALHFGPGIDGLRGRLATAMDKLAVALWAQLGVLLAIAIALQFDGFGPSVGWIVLGIAAIEIGRRLPSPGVTAFGLIVGALAILRIASIDPFSPALSVTLWSASDVQIDGWAVLALIGVAAIHVAAKRIGGPAEALRTVMPIVLAAAGSAAWLGLTAVKAEGVTLTVLWLAGGVVLLLAAPLGRRERYLEIAIALLVASCAKWVLSDAVAHRMGAPAAEQLVLLNVRFGMGVLLIGVLALAAMLSGRSAASASHHVPVRTICMALIGVVAFALGTAEIDHALQGNDMARQMGLSIFWALYGVALVLLGFVRLWTACRYVGLALLFITIVKVLAVDMQTVDRLWRILSFIVSGLLLIATSMAYAKLAPRLLTVLASKAHAPS